MSFTQLITKGINKVGLLNRLNITFRISIAGQDVLIPAIHGFGSNYLFQDNEPWFSDILLLLDDGKETVIDVGANTGQSLLKFIYQGKYSSYIGFEPNPGCCYYLNELIAINKISEAIICNAALSNQADILPLILTGKNWDSTASIVPGFRKNREGRRINVATLKGDDIIFKMIKSKVSLIKIDVEGAELEVINGLQNTITKYHPFIICEILPAYNSDYTERINRQNEIVEMLRSLNYKIYRILKDDKNRFKELVHINEMGIHDKIEWCDYLFWPLTHDPIT